MAEDNKSNSTAGNDIVAQISDRIKSCDNVLVALSKNPSVDELAAAIGTTLMLDGIGKHATAIFSGKVPNALSFLEPEKTFEKDTNSLQDFIIALNKEKADHLRYKVDGDFVKVFITPYRTTIDEKDLEFSHGDFNVDLVIALGVSSADDLDAALHEHGRIMHDASSINIAATAPGGFGDIKWGNPVASSTCEMICTLEEKLREDKASLLDKTSATAFLTGIVAATERFSNVKTSPEAMALAGKLMEAGADQQIISLNIAKTEENTIDKEAEKTAVPESDSNEVAETEKDDTSLVIPREDTEENKEETTTYGAVEFTPTDETTKVDSEQKLEENLQISDSKASGPLMDELREASEQKDYAAIIEQELAQPIPGTPELVEAPLENPAAQVVPSINTVEMPAAAINYEQATGTVEPAALIAPEQQFIETGTIPNAEPIPAPLPLPTEGVLPPAPPPFDPNQQITELPQIVASPVQATAMMSPNVAQNNLETAVSPVPLAPVQNMGAPVMPGVVPIQPATPAPEVSRVYLGSNQAMPDQVYPDGGQFDDPGAFKLPGT